ncbi:dipeptide ABC transporter ATP-binding protein [Nonomuraea sp. NPDC004297]
MSREPVIRFADLGVTFGTETGDVHALKGVSFAVHPGEILAVVGESGSGKSVTTRAALRLLPANATVTGEIHVGGQAKAVGEMSESELRALRGAKASMIFQEPSAALDPVYRVGAQIVESIRLHRRVSRKQAWARAVELLDLVGMPEPERTVRAYPHQLSGGQKQRVMIAMAVALEPDLIIADEPTTALDVTVQAGILELLRSLRDRLSTAVLLITHNMGVVADLADRVVVMRHGVVVEQGPVLDVLTQPREEYTRTLLRSVPRMLTAADREPGPVAEGRQDADREVALELSGVSVDYPGGFRRKPFRALHEISFRVPEGRLVGLVGESGSGKSTVTKCVVGLLAPSQGQVRVLGQDVAALRGAARDALRRDIGMVFQDPRASMNPRMTVGDGIAEPMVIHRIGGRQERQARVREVMDAAQLDSGLRDRYPHELSGGQRQRAGIARALVLRPRLLIADEPTSALDVTVQARVLELLKELQAELDFACLFITHDLAVVSDLAEEMVVLRRGRLVEQGRTESVLLAPREAYTRALIDAVPLPDPVAQRERRLTRQQV